ncbi:hypothetical protein HGO37_26215 [Rhizobium sp. CG4]|uniref:hypothetical protein n=1 Tax=Rhizobium sp. CG4 TaxID=2726075 RepID=UPI00203358C0|nr:hypothetical protein [Rhizobium sp. CG4]MCM2458880.1 hypothetical protein [Rhizobium sp. CG4]
MTQHTNHPDNTENPPRIHEIADDTTWRRLAHMTEQTAETADIKPAQQPGTTPAVMPADDQALLALQAELHEAAKVADQRFRDMPEDMALEDELAEIDAIMQLGDALAERMFALTPTTSSGIDARVRAEAWHSGDYITTYLRPYQ